VAACGGIVNEPRCGSWTTAWQLKLGAASQQFELLVRVAS